MKLVLVTFSQVLTTKSLCKMTRHARILEKTIATASFAVAVVLTFVSLAISEDHDIASNVLFVIAQFLTLTATLLGIDYKFSHNGSTIGTPTTGTPQ